MHDCWTWQIIHNILLPFVCLWPHPIYLPLFVLCNVLSYNFKEGHLFEGGDEDVIAVFDFDYATMEEFNVKVGWVGLQ
jgi:hypothetical protein